ncbi:unnamed protein product [Polarella glacialis]|uniref:UBC core domain-containing protein n=1 Tax=Polarella glacialis TaxID=89957 RepID=A0A813KKC4_POLGL|nr:unnamed protein product [Polarella glacialis]
MSDPTPATSSREPRPPKSAPKREAFVSVLFAQGSALDQVMLHAEAIRTLAFSARRHCKRQRPYIVVSDGPLPEEAAASLRADGLEILEADPNAITWPKGKQAYGADGEDIADLQLSSWWAERGVRPTAIKLAVWNMTSHDRLLFLDADTLIMAPVDELFELDTFASGLNPYSTHGMSEWKEGGVRYHQHPGINTGVMLLQPSMKVTADMADDMASGTHDNSPVAEHLGRSDQPWLDAFWLHRSRRLGVAKFVPRPASEGGGLRRRRASSCDARGATGHLVLPNWTCNFSFCKCLRHAPDRLKLLCVTHEVARDVDFWASECFPWQRIALMASCGPQLVDTFQMEGCRVRIAGAAEQRGRLCPICLSDEGGLEAFEDLSFLINQSSENAPTPPAMRCGGQCHARFHRECVAQHALAAAQRGLLPLRCPVPECLEPWPAEIAAWALDVQQHELYLAASRSAQEQREDEHRVEEAPVSPRTEEALKRLGVRPCPRCRCLIQKQAEGLLTGCDKMTCRCGSMFCFRCGMEARAGGVARCRCVGAHHGFIAQSQVLNNYTLFSSSSRPPAADQDLTKRPKGTASKEAASRLRKELKAILNDPPPFVHIYCDESNLLLWHFLIQGPPDTPYEGGWYWGKLEIPKDYPFWPPLIKMFTPSGRFEVDTWLCRTQADYHPEGWQPAWAIGSLLIALLALICDDSFTSGAVHPPASDSDKRALAHQSLAWNVDHAEFRRAFASVLERSAKDRVKESTIGKAQASDEQVID